MVGMGTIRRQIARATLVFVGMAIATGLLAVSPLSGQSLFGRAAAAPLAGQAARTATKPLGAGWYTCTPVAVGVFPTRVHVQCAESGQIVDSTDVVNLAMPTYFAVPTLPVPPADSNHVNRVLELATAAMSSGRTLSVFFSWDDGSGESFNCYFENCRALLGIEMN